VVFYIGSADRRLRQQAERKLLLESERAARIEAERVDRLKNEFLATLSHELRNPLNAILGWTQLLLRGTIDVEKAAHIIEQSARLQAQLIEDLLDMSRIESGKLLLKKSVVELSNLLGIELVAADSIRLNQVVINLLSNAIKFTARGGRVTVSLAREGQEAVLTISDTGEGISADFIPYVFVRFRQADQSTTRRSGGLGMGMAIAKHITELHGGTISVQSPGLGKGSTFVVRLPLTERAGAEATRLAQVREREGPRADAALMGRSIMVVEDDPATRELLARVLCEKGAAVTTCERSAEALAKLRAHRPDLIISDIGMPDMDGYELMRQVRHEPHDTPHIPAIAVTAFARAEDKDAALRVGFDGHIPKPINLQHLERLAADLISARAGGA
jgi:CheY-like chemotaxis protein